jgi:hypothetical protein
MKEDYFEELDYYEFVERCKHVKSRATTVYFSIGRLGRVCEV